MQTKRTNPRLIAISKPALGLLASLVALLAAPPSVRAQSGTWTNLIDGNASGSWATAANWNNGVIADGADNTANFSTLDLTGTNSVVTLDGARTIGNIIFGDTTPSTNWVLNTGTAGPLTLAVTAGTPTLTANNGTNTIGAVLAGANGFTKAGAGTLRLNGANATLSGNININAGILQAGNAAALGTQTPNNTELSNAVVIASGATLQIVAGQAPLLKPTYASGAGVGGAQGAIYADLSTLANNNNATRYSIGLNNAGSPAVIMLGDTTIRIDGTNSTALGSVVLIGHITTSNALTGIPANYTNYTLTKTGLGRFAIDPANGYSGGNIHIAEGSIRFGNNNDLPGSQTVTIDPGAGLYMGNINSMNSINSSLIVNGLLELNGRGNGNPGSDVTVAVQTIGYLSGSGVVTNGSGGNSQVSTLVIGGANGSITTFSGRVSQSANGSVGLRLQNTNSTLRLTGDNTYAGPTVINAGTLLVNGSHTNGAGYTVAPDATLGGSGTIYPAINLSGTLRAGDGGGTLNVSSVTGTGNVIVSNANLTASGQLNNSGSGDLTSLYLNNSVTTFNLQGGSEAAIYATTVNVDGANNALNVLMANPVTGQFPLIGHIATIGGLNGFNGLQLQLPSGVGAYLSNNIAGNSSIDIVITNVPQVIWRGTPTGDWAIGGAANWFNGTPVTYTETAGLGPFVLFDDTLTGTANVNLTTAVSPRGVTVNASSTTYTLSGSGNVGGTGNWLKGGSSTFIVANSGANNFSGNVTINGGTLQLGNGGTAGNLGAAAIINSGSGSLAFNRSDDVTFTNAISGNGTLVKQAANKVTLSGSGSGSGAVMVNGGTLALAPAGTITLSGDVTGSGAFGAGGGTVILTSGTLTYGGGTVISNGTLRFDAAFPPAGNIMDNGTLALAVSGTLANNVSGAGGVSVINNAFVTLAGANTYSGPTVVLDGSVDATAATYPSGSVLRLGSQNGTNFVGTANFTAGNPVIGGLNVGGNTFSPNAVNLSAGNQTLSINGNLSVGNIGPAGATVLFQPTGAGATIAVNTNGGTIQIGLGAAGSGVNPDNVLADLSGIDNFVANLGATGVVNLGTLDNNPGPTAGATVVNQFKLASVSNSITAGTITIGAGGRQLTPELRLGAGTNVLNADTVRLGAGGRDGGYLLFDGPTGGVRVRATDGVSRANLQVGVAVTTTGANLTDTVDLTGHPTDLLLNALVLGSLNNLGTYQCAFSFDTGVLDASSTSLSVLRNTSTQAAIDNAALSFSTLNIGGGTASLGLVSLTASAAPGNLNITGGSVTVHGIADTGAGTSTLDVSDATLNVNLPGFGNPAVAPVSVDVFNASGTVNLGVNGSGFTVGQFPLIKYTGAIGGSGFAALNLISLPAGVTGSLSNNTANLSVDLVITAAPPAGPNPIPTNIVTAVSGNQLQLSWPASHTGWLLQSNSVSLTSPAAWFTVAGASATNQMFLTMDPTTPNVFFRLQLP